MEHADVERIPYGNHIFIVQEVAAGEQYAPDVRDVIAELSQAMADQLAPNRKAPNRRIAVRLRTKIKWPLIIERLLISQFIIAVISSIERNNDDFVVIGKDIHVVVRHQGT